MRAAGVQDTKFAALGRGICGTLGNSLILNVPGSPRGAVTSLRAVIQLIPHALRVLEGNESHDGTVSPEKLETPGSSPGTASGTSREKYSSGKMS